MLERGNMITDGLHVLARCSEMAGWMDGTFNFVHLRHPPARIVCTTSYCGLRFIKKAKGAQWASLIR